MHPTPRSSTSRRRPARRLAPAALLAALCLTGLSSAAAGPAPWSRPMTVPLRVSSAYGVPGDWLAGHHTGVDFAVPTGTLVRAVSEGTVLVAGPYGNYGNTVLLRLADGYYALYAHLSRVAVSPGRTVASGTLLGHSGATGRVTGPHLHFEIRRNQNYGSDVDPLAHLAAHGVKLSTRATPGEAAVPDHHD
ncbi:M23 family metallopeptidase [Streptomyces sp. NPDC059740]|uniref:M23 family metallopeptidase n=1 Tax=Streptomyces sp. NPDC059740 TaxID=3346926 RepID=UPI00364A50EE